MLQQVKNKQSGPEISLQDKQKLQQTIIQVLDDIETPKNIVSKLKDVYYFDVFVEEAMNCILSQSTLDQFVQEVNDYLIQAQICAGPKQSMKFCAETIDSVKNLTNIPQQSSSDDDENEQEIDDKDLVLDTNEEQMDGCCEMCLTQDKITLHHAIPKLMIKRLRRKKIKAPVIYIKLCAECHAKVHKTFPHAILAKKYYTIQALLDCEELSDYITNKRRFISSKQ